MKFVIEDYTDESMDAIVAATDLGLEAVSLMAAKKMAENMIDSPTIQVGEGGWRRQVGKVVHSFPGDFPFRQTGNLARSITNGRIGDREWAAGTTPGYHPEGVPYGFILEKGTKDGTIKPRPWLWASIKPQKRRLKKEFERVFHRGMEFATR